MSRGWLINAFYAYYGAHYDLSDTLKVWKGYWLCALKDSLKVIYDDNNQNTLSRDINNQENDNR